MKILVIGDGLIDHNVFGLISRQSPEDPAIPVVDFVQEEYLLGGCLNVAANARSLSHPRQDEVYATTIMSEFTANIAREKGISCDESVFSVKDEPHKRELVKTRIINSESLKQICRLDNRLKFADRDLQKYKNKCYYYNIKNFDLVIVSDYNKGLVDNTIIEFLSHELVDCPIFVDTKNPDMIRWQPLNKKNIFFKVNSKEWEVIQKKDPQQDFRFIVTASQYGAKYLHKDQEILYPTIPVNSPSVVGAGDVFLAALSIQYAKNGSIDQSITYANKAARKSVEMFGTCEVRSDQVA